VLGLAYGAEIGGAVALELEDKVYVPINDPQGDIVALVDPSGQLVENYRYTAFGEIEVFSDIVLNNPWKFSSKRFDPETGFIYFGRRYYDPEIGRWITPDPAGFADGPNLYAYVHNHPLAYMDPDGQFAFFLVPIAISLAADYILPAAAAFAQPYVGPLAGALLTGLAKGYTGDYSLDGIDPSSQ
jgi:RHS repeat-associated protein